MHDVPKIRSRLCVYIEHLNHRCVCRVLNTFATLDHALHSVRARADRKVIRCIPVGASWLLCALHAAIASGAAAQHLGHRDASRCLSRSRWLMCEQRAFTLARLPETARPCMHARLVYVEYCLFEPVLVLLSAPHWRRMPSVGSFSCERGPACAVPSCSSPSVRCFGKCCISR